MKDSCSQNKCRCSSIRLRSAPVDARRDYIEQVCSIMLRDRFGNGFFAEVWGDDDDHRRADHTQLDLMPSPGYGVGSIEVGSSSGRWTATLRLGRIRQMNILGHMIDAVSPLSAATHSRGSPYALMKRTQRGAKRGQTSVVLRDPLRPSRPLRETPVFSRRMQIFENQNLGTHGERISRKVAKGAKGRRTGSKRESSFATFAIFATLRGTPTLRATHRIGSLKILEAWDT